MASKKGKGDEEEKYVFMVEWYDSLAALNRRYSLTYFASDRSVEMVDLKTNRIFLRRTPYPSVSLSDLFVGSRVNIYSRQLKILDYGSESTRSRLKDREEKAFVCFTTPSFPDLGIVLDALLQKHELKLVNMRMLCLSADDEVACVLFGEKLKNLDSLSPECLVSVFIGAGARSALHQEIEIRSARGRSLVGAAREDDEIRLISHFFPTNLSSLTFANEFKGCLPSVPDDVTCCILKPELAQDASLGKAIALIQDAGFEMLAVRMMSFSDAEAEEFLAVYKGVLPEHPAMVSNLSSGSFLALALKHRDGDSVRKLREISGPIDPDVARSLRPYTLRAKFGKTRVANGVHCSDLEEDGVLECEYIFKLLL